MEDWKMTELKAHQQFTLGRLDGLRWVLDRTDCLNREVNAEDKQDVQDRVRELALDKSKPLGDKHE